MELNRHVVEFYSRISKGKHSSVHVYTFMRLILVGVLFGYLVYTVLQVVISPALLNRIDNKTAFKNHECLGTRGGNRHFEDFWRTKPLEIHL